VRTLDALTAAMVSRTAAYERACYGWAVKHGTLLEDPFAGLPGRTADARERVLDD